MSTYRQEKRKLSPSKRNLQDEPNVKVIIMDESRSNVGIKAEDEHARSQIPNNESSEMDVDHFDYCMKRKERPKGRRDILIEHERHLRSTFVTRYQNEHWV